MPVLYLLETPQLIMGPSLPLSPFATPLYQSTILRGTLLRNPLAMAAWESGRWSSLSFLSSIANPWYHPQPCSKTLSGTCPSSLTLLLGDSTELHGKPSFSPSCEPCQHSVLDQSHSFESVPRNTLYSGLPVTTLVRNSEPLPTRQPIASHHTFLRSREGNGNQGAKHSTGKIRLIPRIKITPNPDT